jgi:hypothetical protein
MWPENIISLHNTILSTSPSSNPPSLQGILGDVGDNTEDSQIELTENSQLYRCQVTRCFTKAHTFTSCPLPCYTPNIQVDNVLLSFFNHALPKFKVRPVSPDFRFEADWLKCAAPQTVSHSVGQPIPNPWHDPRTLPLQGARQQQLLLCEKPKAWISWVSRTEVDLPMRTFIQNLWKF